MRWPVLPDSTLARLVAFFGPILGVYSQSNGDLSDYRLHAGAWAAGCIALAAMLKNASQDEESRARDSVTRRIEAVQARKRQEGAP